jgi:hypothetical protein
LPLEALTWYVADLEAVLNIYAGDGSYQSHLQHGRSFGIAFREFN